MPAATASASRAEVPAASGRWAGSRLSSASMTGASGPADGARGASSAATPAMMAIEPPGRSNGPRPSTAAYSVAPSDHRSEAGVALPPRTRSGAVNPGVPTTMSACVMPGSSANVAMPKSLSTARPSAEISTLLGFTSRCSTPAACAVSRALSSRAPSSAACSGGSGPSSAMTCSRDRPPMNSMMIHGLPSSSTTSKTVTTAGWLSRAAVRASRRVRW